jgi:membrane fusion protein, multidrug efflux system
MQAKRLATVTIVAVAVIGIAFFAMGASQRSSASADAKAAAPDGRPGAGGPPGAGKEVSEVKTVKTAAVAVKTLRPYLDEGGDVQTAVNVSVYPDIGGKLVDMKIVVGDSVQKGESIASVDPSKPGSSYAISEVASPIAGTVTSVIAEPGETVTSSTALAKVGVVDDLEIVVNLPERDSAKVKKGMIAKVSLAALPGESLSAYVAKVSPVLDATSRTRQITLKFDKKDERVAAGMYSSVRLYITPLADRKVIPEAAVITRNEESYVFTVVDSEGQTVAKKKSVKTGQSVDGTIEVTDGLVANEKIVVEGQDLLSDGTKISDSSRGAE